MAPRPAVKRTRVDRGIYKLGDGLYELVVSAGLDAKTGKYRQKWKRHHGLLTSAREARRLLLAEVVAGEHAGTAGTVDELFDRWLADLERMGRAPKTISGYRYDAVPAADRVTVIELHRCDRHTPALRSDVVAETYNAWRALRALPAVTFVRAPLPDAVGGAVCASWPDGSAVIVIDPVLRRRDRHAALAHELVHLERGVPCQGSTATSKEERAVRHEVARRLVPSDALRNFVDRMLELGEPVTARHAADEFDVPIQLAELALTLLGPNPWGNQ